MGHRRRGREQGLGADRAGQSILSKAKAERFPPSAEEAVQSSLVQGFWSPSQPRVLQPPSHVWFATTLREAP